MRPVAMTATAIIMGDTPSPRRITPSGMANAGADDESTAPTVQPAYLRLATNTTELAAVLTLSTPMRTSGRRPLVRRLLAAPRAHGVSHSRAEAIGRRIACAVSGSISRSGGF